MKKYLVEFIGTFFLVFTVVFAENSNLGSLAPIAIGSMLIAMIYAGFHISGAHYNPAVTLSVWIRGKLPASEIPGYLISQFSAAMIASTLAKYLLASMDIGIKSVSAFQFLPGTIAEFIGTFALVFVILNVATAPENKNKSHYGLSIGLTVIASAYTLGEISGGAFNPAVAAGMSLSEMVPWSNMSGYLFGQIAAAAAAAFLYKLVNAPRQQ